MFKIDIEQFVATGDFGTFGRNANRNDVVMILGPPDACGYPDHDKYGNVAFEFGDAATRSCRIMIGYPHSLSETPDAATELNNGEWPDQRFSFSLGRFVPGLKLHDIVGLLPGFVHAEMIGASPQRICIYTNPKTNIDLCFAPETNLADHSLYCIVSQPAATMARTAG